MHPSFTTPLAILLLVLFALGCSSLGPKRPLTWHLLLEIDAPVPEKEDTAQQAAKVIEGRLNALGFHNFEVRPEGPPANGRILVNLPDVPDRERLKKVITDRGLLELMAVVGPLSPSPIQSYSTKEEAITSLGGTVPANRRVLRYAIRDELTTAGQSSEARSQPAQWVAVEAPAIVDNSQMRTAVAVPSHTGADDYQISFSLTTEGAKRFASWTGAHIRNYLGVVLDGEVKSIAYIQSQIADQGEISGRFTKASAEDLALILRSGALPAAVKIIEEGPNK